MTTYRPFLRLGILAASFLAYSTLGFAGAQDASSVQKPDTGITVLRKNVRRVLVDVVVTGPHEEPVRGLTKEDFTVLEDGKQQTIRTFDVHDFTEQPESLPSVPTMPPNTFLNLPHEAERGPLFVLLYDLVNIEQEDQAYARQQLLRFIQNKPAGVRFAVIVISDGMHLVQGFTEDKSKLLAVLDSHSNKPHVPEIFLMGRNNGQGETSFSISAFTELAHYLEGFSGRKNIVWFSGRFPLSLLANFDNDLTGDGSFTDKTKDLVDTLARNQIAIYPVDVQGVITTEVFAPSGSAGPSGGMSTDYRTGNGSQASPSGGASNASASAGPGSPPASAGAASSSSGSTIAAGGPGFSQTSSAYMAEDELAKVTGGHAYYSRNNLSTILEKAVENGANYYTLSYSPTNETYNGKVRKIKVELARKGYTLSYRRSYFGVDLDTRPKTTDELPPLELAGSRGSIPQDDPFSVAMRHGGPMAHDLIFRAQVHSVGQPAMATPEQMSRLVEDPGALRRHKQNAAAKPVKPIPLQSYSIDYRVAIQPTASSPAGAQPGTIEIAAAAFDADGNMLSGVLQDAVRNSANQPAAKNAAFFSVQQQLDVPVKAAWIRLAVRDLSTNRVGTLEVPLPLAPESQTASTVTAPTSAHPH